MISLVIHFILVKRKRNKLGRKLVCIEPIQEYKPMGKFFLWCSLLLVLFSIFFSYIENWIFSLFVIPASLNMLLISINDNKSHKLLGLYEYGIDMSYDVFF